MLDSAIIVNEAQQRYLLGSHAEYLEDPSGELTFSQLHDESRPQRWRPLAGNHPDFGYSTSSYWLVVDLHNGSVKPMSYLLELGNPGLDRVEFFLVADDQLRRSYVVGKRVAYGQRPVDHRHFLFPITLQPNEDARLYLRMESRSLLKTSLYLWERGAFKAHDAVRQTLEGSVLALLLASLAYPVLFRKRGRDGRRTPFVAFTATSVLALLAWSGYGYRFLWSSWPEFNAVAASLFISASAVAEAMLVKRALRLGRRNRRIALYFSALIACGTVLLLTTPFLPARLLDTLLWPFMLLVSISGFSAGLWVWIRERYHAAPFALGAACLLIARIAMLFIGVAPPNGPALPTLMYLSGAAAVAAWAWALALRPRGPVQAALAARALVDQGERNAHMMQDLHDLLIRAPRVRHQPNGVGPELDNHLGASERDTLTGVYTRHWFDDRYMSLWRRAVRRKQPLSLLLIDLDDFKKLNEDYGHRVGDACLKAVAGLLTRYATAPSQAVARYGGGEFVLILPETPQDRAAALADAIRHDIEQLNLDALARGLRLSVSIGVATLDQSEVVNPDGLLNAADNALYKAKYRGRNQIVVAVAR